MVKFEWLGQGLAVDAANTVVRAPSDGYRDLLEEPGAFERWLELERIDRLHAPRNAAFLALRDHVRALLFSLARGTPPPRTAIVAINRTSAAARGYPALRLEAGELRIRTVHGAGRRERLLVDIARSAIELAAGPDRERLRVCDAPGCGMFFLLSRPQQRWCSQPCGNRARVSRHYRRRRLGPRRAGIRARQPDARR